ncbi:unnamed protein product [Phytophthora fragariaefolia]|uniref:Unnamed protein product n=1 Tax=Phytophthora fragariaefolia TaxID=1490495 RepID=A0A9W6U3I8_9STRA|nr:unnamed protein product [Phytophthora fragariaefolia]
MARWLSLLAEYNFQVEYKPGRLNVVADALSRRPDYAAHKANTNAIGVVRTSTPSSSLLDDVRSTYANNVDAKQLLDEFAAPSDKSRQKVAKYLRARVHRSRIHNGLMLYGAVGDNADRVVVPDDHEQKLRIIYELHDAPTSGHPGREKSYLLITRGFYCSYQYKWVRKYVRACEVCQHVNPAPISQVPLQSLPTSSECWQSISMDFVFGLPPDNKRRTGIVVFVDRFSKMAHPAAVPAEVTAKQTTRLFVDMVFGRHGMPIDNVSDRVPRFTARFWHGVFERLGMQLSMSTPDHPQTDGKTERVNRVLVDALKNYARSFHHWSDCLTMAEFDINNSVHASTGHTPFYVNAKRHLRLWRHMHEPHEVRSARAQYLHRASKAMDFVKRRQAVIRFVLDAIAASVNRQKLNADNNDRGNTNEFKIGSLVLLATQNLAKHAVSDFGASKIAPRFIGPFTVLAKHGNAYTLAIPSSMRLHPNVYVGRLKSNSQHESSVLGDSAPTPA